MKRCLYLLLSILSLAIPASSQITHTDINPDTTLQASVMIQFHRYDIDIDRDGTYDFYVKHFHPTEEEREAEFYTYMGKQAEVMLDPYDFPLALTTDSVINGSKTWRNGATPISSIAFPMSANWAGKGDRYMGLRIKLNNHWHYGWIKMEVPADTSRITLKEFAVNMHPDWSIKPGQLVPIGIQDLCSSEQKISIYPNPVKSTAIIASTAEGVLAIYNAHGKMVKSLDIKPKENTALQTGGMAAGIYYYELQQSSETISVGKFMVID